MAVTVRKVETPADFKVFFEFPWTLYKGDPNWVPPLLSMRRDTLDKKKNAAWKYLEGDYYVAWRGNQPVGTISAFINPRHNQFHNEHIGWFGMFEVYDDQEVADALLNTAVDWVKAQGYDGIRGPSSFTTHEEVGLLVDNFTRPVILMPYNPPYYQKLVESNGFVKAMDLYSYFLSNKRQKEVGSLDRLERITNGVMKRHDITVRQVNRKNLKADFELFKELYNAAWEKNWGFVPMTSEELDSMVESLGLFFDAKLAFFAFVNNQPAGFVLPIPDFNQVLHRVYPRPGVPEIWSLLKALYYWKLNPIITGARSPLFGIKEEYRKKGVDAVLLFHALRALVQGNYEFADNGWILEANPEINIVLKSIGAEVYKTHRFYEKSFKNQ